MVLVSLFGNLDSYLLPIFYEFSSQISKHIILHDDSYYESKKAKKILQAQKKFRKKAKLNYDIKMIEFDEDDFKSVMKCYKEMVRYAGERYEDIYFNGTGGLASTSFIIAQKLIKNGAKFISYDVLDNSYNLITKTSMKKVYISKNQNIKEHLMLKGHKIVSRGNAQMAQKRKNYIFKLCPNLNKLKSFAKRLYEDNYDQVNGYDDIKYILEIMGKTDNYFIQGAIFEEYVYWLIKDNFDFDDVMFNVKVELAKDVYNEFDVLMIKNNHLHTIECKLRNDGARLDFLYKLDALIDYIDDDGKAMLISVGKIRKSNKALLKRARYINLKIYQKSEFDENVFLEDIKNHFFVQRT